MKKIIALCLCFISISISGYAQCEALDLPREDLVRPISFMNAKSTPPEPFIKGQRPKRYYYYPFEPRGGKTVPLVVYNDLNRTTSQIPIEYNIRGFYEYPNADFDVFIICASNHESITTYLVIINTDGKVLDYLETRVGFQPNQTLFKQYQMVNYNSVHVYELDIVSPKGMKATDSFYALKGTVYLTCYEITKDGLFKVGQDGKMTNHEGDRTYSQTQLQKKEVNLWDLY